MFLPVPPSHASFKIGILRWASDGNGGRGGHGGSSPGPRIHWYPGLDWVNFSQLGAQRPPGVAPSSHVQSAAVEMLCSRTSCDARNNGPFYGSLLRRLSQAMSIAFLDPSVGQTGRATLALFCGREVAGTDRSLGVHGATDGVCQLFPFPCLRPEPRKLSHALTMFKIGWSEEKHMCLRSNLTSTQRARELTWKGEQTCRGRHKKKKGKMRARDSEG